MVTCSTIKRDDLNVPIANWPFIYSAKKKKKEATRIRIGKVEVIPSKDLRSPSLLG
jgi:hypothetical protein